MSTAAYQRWSVRFLGATAVAMLLGACGTATTPTPDTENPATPVAETPYYQGKRIEIVTPGSPGGGYDLFSRLVATYMQRHIPGNPQILVNNMPGGATFLAPNWLYSDAAPRDGTVIGNYVASNYLDQFVGSESVHFDVNRFIHLGSPTYTPSVMYCRVDRVGNRSPFEIAEAQQAGQVKAPLINGRQSADDEIADFIALTTGMQIQTVAGYAASAEVNRGFRAGESDCAGSTLDSTLIALEDMFEAGEMNFIGQAGTPNGSREPRVPDAPTFDELAGDNPRYQFIADFISVGSLAGRPFVAPPGVPDNVIQILRKAFAATMSDHEFIAAGAEAGYEIFFVEPERIEELHTSIFEASAEDKEAILRFLGR